MMQFASRPLLLTALLILSAGSIVFASFAGSVAMDPASWWAALFNPDSMDGEMLWKLRLPRAFAAWTVGAMLAGTSAAA